MCYIVLLFSKEGLKAFDRLSNYAGDTGKFIIDTII